MYSKNLKNSDIRKNCCNHPKISTTWLHHRIMRPKGAVGWLCWGLTSQSTIFQSYRDGATASWVINQYFRGVKCLAQGHNTAAVGFEPPTSRSGVRHSTTEPPRSPPKGADGMANGAEEQFDLGLNCLPRPFCPKTYGRFPVIFKN